MATRSRRASGNRTSSLADSNSAAAPPHLADQVQAAPLATLNKASETLSQLSKAELALQIDALQSVLRSAQMLREAQLEANQKAQAAHAQAAEQLASMENLSDIASVQLTLLRDDVQGAVAYWGRIGELTAAAALDGWSRSAEGLSRLQSGLWSSALQWTQLAQIDAPAAAEELEASVDHLVNPLIASPMLWPTQEAAREAMTLASSALNDWFSWSGLHRNGGAPSAAGVVH